MNSGIFMTYLIGFDAIRFDRKLATRKKTSTINFRKCKKKWKENPHDTDPWLEPTQTQLVTYKF